MHLNHIRYGSGRPLLLVHGLGGSWRSWCLVLARLAEHREVIAIDLPGFGGSRQLEGPASIAALADSVAAFTRSMGLENVDAVGSCLGGRVVLELVRRRGVLASAVALDPCGFARGWQRHAFFTSVWLANRTLRGLRPELPPLTRTATGRAVLLAQFSTNARAMPAEVVLDEVRCFAGARSLDQVLFDLAFGEVPKGLPEGAGAHPLSIGWGRSDRVCFPNQASHAASLFPDAQLHWFDRCGHFPQWDAPEETVRLVLESTGERPFSAPAGSSATPHELALMSSVACRA